VKYRIAPSSWRLSEKIALGFTLLIGMLLLLAGVGALRLSLLSREMVFNVETGVERSRAIHDMERSAHEYATVLRNFAAGEPEGLDVQLQLLRQAIAAYQQATARVKQFAAKDAEGTNLLEVADRRAAAMKQILEQAVHDMAGRGEAATGFQVRVMLRRDLAQWNARQDAWVRAIDRLSRWDEALGNEAVRRAGESAGAAERVLISGATLALVVAILVAFLIAKDVRSGLSLAVHAAEQMSRFDLSTPVRARRRDEIGVVLDGMETMRVALASELALRARELAENKALKSAIIDHALEAIVSCDEQGRIVEFNPAAESMFGRTRQETLGTPLLQIVLMERGRDQTEGAGELLGLHSEHEGSGQGKRLQLQGLRADRTVFPVEVCLWRTAVGDSIFYSASMIDLTERQIAARQIEQQREALRHSEKLTTMGGLLAGVAHELNNPLAVAMGRAILLEERSPTAALRADARRIREATERCGRIVRTFLNMARGKASTRTAVDLHAVVDSVVDLLQYAYRTHGIQLTVLPEPSGSTSVQADVDQISQIVINLLINAQQALESQEGRRHVEISLRSESEASGESQSVVCLRVRDNGPGVEEDLRAKIFEPFFTTKREEAGTGLGLSVSLSIARAHGGDLVLEPSADQCGACFCLRLPAAQALPAGSEASSAVANRRSHARVLVIDDEPEVASVMQDMLEAAGFEVVVASSAKQALEIIDSGRFDCVVSDFRMPEMDGEHLWRQVRSRQGELATRMLFVTGDALSHNVSQFCRDSRCQHLEKPFTKQELLSKVNDVLS
jgi:two-component system NtrC family sensor kinase